MLTNTGKYMKRILLVIICSILFTACSLPGNSTPTVTPTSEPTAIPTEISTEIPTEIPTEVPTEVPTEIPTPTPEPHSAVLVVYFSRTGEQSSVGVIDKGNTEIVAEMIAEKTQADIFQILPEVDNYPMTYRALTEVAKREQDTNVRPAYAGEVNDLAGYETIFIGAPVWWYTFPMIIYTFFDKYDFSGKTIVPFNTHMGSGDGGTYETIQKLEPNAKVLTGLQGEMRDAENGPEKAVEKWLKSLNE